MKTGAGSIRQAPAKAPLIKLEAPCGPGRRRQNEWRQSLILKQGGFAFATCALSPAWMQGTSIRALKALKKALQAPDTDAGETSETQSSDGKDNKQDDKIKHPVVIVRHKAHTATLLIHETVDEGMAWIERSDGQRLCVAARELLLEGIKPAA